MLNLATVLDSSVREYPEKDAIIFEGKRFTFAQLNAAVNQIANGLVEMGVGKGDKVALSCPNLPYWPMVYYAILRVGGVVVPLNVLLKSREVAYHLKDSKAKAIFCFQGTPELPMADEARKGFSEVDSCENFIVITADPVAASPIEGTKTLGQLMGPQSTEFETVQTEPDDSAVILYTSGTTGYPKGAELTHCNLVTNTLTMADMFHIVPEDISIIAVPMFHAFGQVVQMNATYSKGATIIIIPRFSPKAILNAIQHEKGTVFAGVPTMYGALLNFEDKEDEYDLKQIAQTLRIGISGGASLPVEIIKGVQEKFDIPIVEGYGLSETSPAASFNHLHKERKPGSVGTPVWGVEIKVVDEEGNELPVGEVGEIAIRGPNVMKGYFNKPEETEKVFKGTSWFHTGDLGKKDEDGYIYIVDRVKDMIIRGGYNVYPKEIEEVLMTHPAISLVAVIGVPHDRHGEEIKALVVLKEGQSATEEELVKWSKEQMAAYKYPRIVEIRESLPMGPTGKILKRELKKE